MISKLYSTSFYGIEARTVEVEVDITSGLPQTTIVGLPDQAIKESKERVKSAIKNSGFQFSPNRLTINLAPADLKKEGPCFDLAIAIGILASSGYLKKNHFGPYLFLGELALDGTLRPVKGILPAAEHCRKMKRRLIIPKENAWEAGLEPGAEVQCAENLKQVLQFLNGELDLPRVKNNYDGHSFAAETNGFDFSEVRGQWQAKRAIEVAIAGGHNLLMIGPPGAGKTMLARRIPSILPPLSREEFVEISKIYSVAGFLNSRSLNKARPFRAPHHTISQMGLAGGGGFPKPGEISLAHGGVLFLDEFPEFHRDVIETLRGPLEEGSILISRAKHHLRFPAKFLLVCAMNPCPCGHLMSRRQMCRCSLGQIQRYMNKISGPIFDRMDIHLEIPAIEYKDLTSTAHSESSETIRRRVLSARKKQAERLGGTGICLNAEMNPREIKKYCRLDNSSKRLLEQAMKELGFSARAYHKIIKLSRTIADLAPSDSIQAEHIAEALQYRSLDRNYFR